MAVKMMPPLPPDIIAAIGNPPTPCAWPSDADIGFWMKIKARKEIDDGLINTREDVELRLHTYAEWFEAMSTVISDEVAARWMRYEQMFSASCLKYLRELKEYETSFKK